MIRPERASGDAAGDAATAAMALRLAAGLATGALRFRRVLDMAPLPGLPPAVATPFMPAAPAAGPGQAQPARGADAAANTASTAIAGDRAAGMAALPARQDAAVQGTGRSARSDAPARPPWPAAAPHQTAPHPPAPHQPAPQERRAARKAGAPTSAAGALRLQAGPADWTAGVHEFATRLCRNTEPSVTHFSVEVPLDEQVLPDTSLRLRLSPDGLALRFRTGDARAFGLLSSASPSLHDMLAQSLPQHQPIAIELT